MPRIISGIFSLVSLALCLAFSVVHFLGRIDADRFKSGFLLASIAWFIFATLWAGRAKKSSKS